MSNCLFTFKDPLTGKEQKEISVHELKAYLFNGGLEALLGDERAKALLSGKTTNQAIHTDNGKTEPVTEITEQGTQEELNKTPEFDNAGQTVKKPYDGTEEDWVNYIKSVPFKNVSFWEFKQAATAKVNNEKGLITWFFDGKQIVDPYFMSNDVNQAALRDVYNNAVKESEQGIELFRKTDGIERQAQEEVKQQSIDEETESTQKNQEIGRVEQRNGKFIALENGTNKPIGVDGGLVSSFSPTLYATKEDAKNAIKAREERNKAIQAKPTKTDEEMQAEKNAKQKAREDKLQADREHTVELISSLQFPDGYSAKKFEQVRSGTGGAITDVFVQVIGKYDDDLHKRIKRAGGFWDGTTGGNTKTWLIPIEKADLLEKVFKNTKKAKEKAIIAKEQEQNAAIEREMQARKLEQERKEQERLLGEELREKYNIKGKFGEKITVSQRNDGYIVSFPYDDYLVNRIRTIAGKENYLPDSKAWRVPYAESQELNDFLTEYEKAYQDRKAQKEAEELRLKEEAQQRANIEQNNDGDADTVTFTEIYGDQYRVPVIGNIIIRNGIKYAVTDIKTKKMTKAELEWEEEAGQTGGWDYGSVKATITAKLTSNTEPTDSDDIRYSKAKAEKPHTSKQSFLAAFTKQLDKQFGQGWTNLLMATGKLKVVSSEEADRVISGGELFHRAWHGSPHDHNKFDSAKIGKGEGAQAYGYGHYFAGAKKVADYYRKKLSEPDTYDIDYKYILVMDGKEYT